MHLVQGGEREALGLLFDRYSRLILNVATRILRDATEAQDVVQDVFLYVHRKSEIFDANRGSVSSWLIQITYSRAITRRHARNARAKADCFRIEELADLGDVGVSLEKLTDARFASEIVKEALGELTERQRETLRMYFFEGYTLREISASLNESFTNTRHHYYRGIEKLKERLKDSLGRATNEGVA
jgi:RNA polymerase sigma-70 factor (ECF subfamily)